MISYQVPESPSTNWRRYQQALAGELPAEALVRKDAERLLHALHAQGWTDVEIATHTQWSTYTVARIRERLELKSN